MKLPAILAAIISVGVIGSGVYFLDATYAREAGVCKVEQRLDRKILMDSARDLQRRQWELLRHYGETKGRMLREYRELEHQRQTPDSRNPPENVLALPCHKWRTALVVCGCSRPMLQLYST